MAGDLADFAREFQEGTRVRIGVPLQEGPPFQEWGVVRSLDYDLLELDLSRDKLPQQAVLRIGGILDVGLTGRQLNLCCKGMVVGGDQRHCLVLRLLEGLAPFEPREYFRQDVYLPLQYRLSPSQSHEEAMERWRQRRWSMEFAAQQPEPGEAAELGALREEIRERLAGCKSATPVAANISGSGVRLIVPERLGQGMLVELSLYLPQAERVLEIVGEVVQVRTLADQPRFSTALCYRFIDEADRDRLIGYLSSQQLRHLSLQAPTAAKPGEPGNIKKGWRTLRVALGVAILAAFLGWQAHSIVAGRERGEKHEIERVFEEGIFQFLKQRR